MKIKLKFKEFENIIENQFNKGYSFGVNELTEEIVIRLAIMKKSASQSEADLISRFEHIVKSYADILNEEYCEHE